MSQDLVMKKILLGLLKAFEIYKKSEGKLDLLIIGSGPEEQLLRDHIENSKYKNLFKLNLGNK